MEAAFWLYVIAIIVTFVLGILLDIQGGRLEIHEFEFAGTVLWESCSLEMYLLLVRDPGVPIILLVLSVLALAVVTLCVFVYDTDVLINRTALAASGIALVTRIGSCFLYTQPLGLLLRLISMLAVCVSATSLWRKVSNH